jgi:16S rRNA (adenine1518-N6/adenine1519-N6)-dimethyltransferase
VQTLAQIKELLDSRAARPKRALGQNFLIDHNLIRKLVDSADLHPGELVLEVGPGTGTMTEELLARGVEVIACELDDDLAAMNRERIPTLPGVGNRFTLIHADCLEGKHAVNPLILQAIDDRPFKLVSNLPYGAGTPLMSRLLVAHPNCSHLAVTIQREVADRLLAAPSTKDYGALSVIAQAAAEIERIALAPPECFWPRPDVTSAMVLLRRRQTALAPDMEALSEFCRDIFAQRRKQLGSLLNKVPGASKIDWDALRAQGLHVAPTMRAEELSPEKIIALGRALGRWP